MLAKKLLAVLTVLTISTPMAFGAYEEIDCTSNPAFEANSCSQCFDGGVKGQWDNIGFLSDEWINDTSVSKIIFKEEQRLPEMINLGGTNTSWSQVPSADDFWEYTEEFDALYDMENEGYLLSSGESVTFLKSKIASAFSLDSNTVQNWDPIGMLVYPITTHEILSDGELTINSEEHRECVLYKSGEAVEEAPVEPKKLPDTGPAEFMLLAILAMILGFGILRVKKSA